MTTAGLLLALIVTFAAAKIFGELAVRVGQPAVLGEMIGGIVVGVSGLHLIDPQQPVLHVLSELGVVLLLFLIGLETDIHRLLEVGGPAVSVAVVGVALPFGAGLGAGMLLHYPLPLSILLGATLTATSVGITARVFADLGHLKSDEAQVVLGAAVVDDILGLVLLSIVAALATGGTLTAYGIGKTVVVAFGFVALALVIGSILAPRLIALVARLRVAKALFFASLIAAFTFAYIADVIGSALIVGAFAAGLVLARTERADDIEHEVYNVAQFFIPIFFVSVGAAVDLRQLNPFHPAARTYLLVGLLLTAIAIAGKFAAGYAAVGRPLRRHVIGVGMIPRGEVGLIFAQLGLSTGLLSGGLYSSVALMVMITTFITPPLLRMLLTKGEAEEAGALTDIVTEAMSDDEERRHGERSSPLGRTRA